MVQRRANGITVVCFVLFVVCCAAGFVARGSAGLDFVLGGCAGFALAIGAVSLV